MNREPSAHSMTVESSDRENLAERVFVLERDNAKLLKATGNLEAANENARGFALAVIAALGIQGECEDRSYDDCTAPAVKAIAALRAAAVATV